ncbi:MAG: histidine--tRNA ligase [Acidimicrobiales bacterium]
MPAASSFSAFQAPSGTRDVLPPESGQWELLMATFARIAHGANYGLILTPIFEDFGLFHRGIGVATDVVGKEMYELTDKGGRHLALRPEVTASVVRAFVQHRPTLPWKVFYCGPNFRYERPQAGRYRQFYQVGLEALGPDDPVLDVEIIELAWDYFAALGLTRLDLRINSLGDDQCRPAYREMLRAYLAERRSRLCPEHQERLDDNPLRVLDCKKEPCREVVTGAPVQLDTLCGACAQHFGLVRDGLTRAGVAFRVDPRLVRGLDYYTRTTFEISALALNSAQDAIGGGGRYDTLVESLGGPPTPGMGFSSGLERTLLACGAEGIDLDSQGPVPLDVFVVDVAGGSDGADVTRQLRRAGLRADQAFGSRSLKGQFKAADRSGAPLAVVIGPDEVAAGTIGLRRMRTGAGDERQVSVARVDVVARIVEELAQSNTEPVKADEKTMRQ